VGNYWSDYDASGNYIIDDGNVDRYPLMQPVDISTLTPPPSLEPEPFSTALVIAIVVLVAIGTIALIVVICAGLLVYVKKRRRKPSAS